MKKKIVQRGHGIRFNTIDQSHFRRVAGRTVERHAQRPRQHGRRNSAANRTYPSVQSKFAHVDSRLPQREQLLLRGQGNGNGGNHDGNGHSGNHGGNHGGNGHSGNHGYNNNNHFDYNGHHYNHEFSWNYSHHNWSRPLPPPERPYRPMYRTWYRPVIPVGWYPYAGAPVIDRILGLTFGTLFDSSLDYLYFNGYEIDGYADHIIYLREVSLLNLLWDDVMLSYDSYDRLVNAQFVYHSAYNDRGRYERVYRKLCRIYGTPFSNTDGSFSWYGGNSTGWVTLAMYNDLGHYYTTVSIGY